MPSNNNGNSPGDVLGNSGSSTHTQVEGNTAKAVNGPDTDLLRSIDNTLQDILTSVDGMSQSAARNRMPGSRGDANKWTPYRRNGSSQNRDPFRTKGLGNMGDVFDQFTDGLGKSLMDSVLGSDFKDKIQASMSSLADQLGVDIDKIPEALGKQLGNHLANTPIGKEITGKLKGAADSAMSSISDAFKNGQGAGPLKDAITGGFKSGMNSLFGKGKGANNTPASSPDAQNMQETVSNAQNVADAANMAQDAASAVDTVGDISNIIQFPGAAARAGTAGTAAAGTAAAGTAAAGALSGVAAAAASVVPPILIAVAALLVIDKALEAFGPAVEGITKLFKAFGSAASRDQETAKKRAEAARKRQEADWNLMIEAPFQILEDSANRVAKAWDDTITTITATQGYQKDDVQTLMSVYAQRLRDEGLTRVVSGTNIMDNLSKVLESGLSGQVAEEFAYLATKLNAAVPTQDFFSYASTYSSIAANAIKDGKSQSEAIAYANAEMETFASNVLYASRQLSGGFSTGLKDAQQLFDYSVQIANASKQGNAAMISGVLTSVSAITGAVAPDLASGIVDAVVKAATGGNSSEIVALRSLAGINASNTEFLRALANNPQGVFSALFTNLAKMQNMSNDNFMEVAEGLSSVFGISMDAFARVDFNYLANAISDMNVNNASLNENMELLISGQTTSTAEQMRMAQINEYMLEEGLAYVLDNEVARAIQEHMWEEQKTRELMEATYAVELKGAAADALSGIKQTVDRIINFLNPFGWMKSVANIVRTQAESAAMNADFLQILELGKVGKGNAKSLYQLTSNNKDLKLVDNLANLMGGVSAYKTASNISKMWGSALLSDQTGLYSNGTFTNALLDTVNKALPKNNIKSMYGWANVSKSTASLLAALPSNVATAVASATSQSSTGQSGVNAAAKNSVDRFIQSIADVTSLEAVKANKNLSYEEWVKTANKFGISDYKAAIEQFGYTEDSLKTYFADNEAKAGGEYANARQQMEDEFWKQSTALATNTQPAWLKWETLITDNQTAMIAQLTDTNAKLNNIYNKEAEFLSAWTSYYVDHTAYSRNTMSAYNAADIITAEKKESGDAVLALANALTANTIGITEGFKDPVVQTNVLLAKILIVAEAIMQQNNTTGGLSLPDALSALSLGMTTQSP